MIGSHSVLNFKFNIFIVKLLFVSQFSIGGNPFFIYRVIPFIGHQTNTADEMEYRGIKKPVRGTITELLDHFRTTLHNEKEEKCNVTSSLLFIHPDPLFLVNWSTMRFGTKNDNNSGNKESTFMYSDVGSVSYIRPSRPIYFPRRSGEAFYSGVVIENG